MKKILSLLLALSLLVALIGCQPADSLNTFSQPELQAQNPETTEDITEGPIETTEWLVEWPSQAPIEETEAVPENTQPEQEDIIDSRPHPADEAEREEQQNQGEENPTQPQQSSNPQTPTESAPTEPSGSGSVPTEPPATGPVQTPTEPEDLPYLDPDGHYTSRDDVALYIYLYHRLPSNYITKTQGDRQYGDYHDIPSSMNIGGDRFMNWEGHLPSGYIYYECDIGTRGGSNRRSCRIVFTTSGIVYYTSDHYNSFTRLY